MNDRGLQTTYIVIKYISYNLILFQATANKSTTPKMHGETAMENAPKQCKQNASKNETPKKVMVECDKTPPANTTNVCVPIQQKESVAINLLTPIAALTIHDHQNESDGDATPAISPPLTRQKSKRLVS